MPGGDPSDPDGPLDPELRPDLREAVALEEDLRRHQERAVPPEVDAATDAMLRARLG